MLMLIFLPYYKQTSGDLSIFFNTYKKVTEQKKSTVYFRYILLGTVITYPKNIEKSSHILNTEENKTFKRPLNVSFDHTDQLPWPINNEQDAVTCTFIVYYMQILEFSQKKYCERQMNWCQDAKVSHNMNRCVISHTGHWVEHSGHCTQHNHLEYLVSKQLRNILTLQSQRLRSDDVVNF